MGHGFVRRVSIRSTVKTLSNFPHVWTVGIRHRVLEKIFPAFWLGLINCLGSFTTSAYPLLAILMDRLAEAILSADFGSHVWSHPRFRSLAEFWFSDVSSCDRDENFIEARSSKRQVRFMREIGHFRFDIVCKTGPVHAIFYAIEQILGWQACNRFCDLLRLWLEDGRSCQ